MTRSLLLSALIALALALAGCMASVTATEVPGEPTSDEGGITGVWTYSVDSPGGGDRGTFTITGESGAYEGEIIAQGVRRSLSDIAHNGNELSFLFQVGNGPFVRCAGVITDGRFEGMADAGTFGSFAMRATR